MPRKGTANLSIIYRCEPHNAVAIAGLTALRASLSLSYSLVLYATMAVPVSTQAMEEATREAYPFGDSSDEEHKEKETGKTIRPSVTSGLCIIE